MLPNQLRKIVSGGQTGVDRAALDVAIYLELEHGGWCPAGRRAEDGRIPTEYHLQETVQRDYSIRTERNVVESDGTLILYRQKTAGGTELTRKLALKHRRPHLCIDLAQSADSGLASLNRWLFDHNIQILNVAGPRESSSPGIGRQTEAFLVQALSIEEDR
jgi:hypothetical protein